MKMTLMEYLDRTGNHLRWNEYAKYKGEVHTVSEWRNLLHLY